MFYRDIRLRQRRLTDPLEFAFARRLEVIEVAVEFVHAALPEAAQLGVHEDAICVAALGEELADCGVGSRTEADGVEAQRDVDR